MSPRILFVICGLIGAGSAIVIWLAARPAPPQQMSTAPPTSAANSSETKRRERAETFLGGNSNIDVRGGQEMRPRW